MKILQEAGSFSVLASTPNALELIEECGRTAYQSFDKKGPGTAEKFVRMIIKRGHESVLEHASMTVRFRNHSRGFTHELVRHRLAAFTQESTRYVDESDLHFVMPPNIYSKDGVTVVTPSDVAEELAPRQWEMAELVEHMQSVYCALLEHAKWKPEDARQFLPIGTTADIVMTANFREWRHVFMMRCHKTAHWEIRRTMRRLLKHCIKVWPPVFADLPSRLNLDAEE